MKLYFVPRTRATRPRWMLEELGVPYELKVLNVAEGENKRPEYLAVHPLGSVPALEDGALKLFESAAILQYLADKYPEKGLAPKPGTPERGEYYMWMMFCMTTVEPPLADIFHNTFLLPEPQRTPALVEKGRRRFAEVAPVLEARLRGREFLVGESFSAADLLLSSLLGWAGSMALTADFPGLVEYAKRHLARPAARRAQS
jgi:glutathione S-transferase